MEMLKEIKRRLNRKFDLKVEVKENKLYFSEFNGYIFGDDTYMEIQDLCERICYWIQEKEDVYCDYKILSEGHEFVIEIF